MQLNLGTGLPQTVNPVYDKKEEGANGVLD